MTSRSRARDFFLCRPPTARCIRATAACRFRPPGQLQTATGDAVLGERGPLILPSGAKVTISPDGTVSADSTIAGKLKLVEFKPTADPQSAGGSYYTGGRHRGGRFSELDPAPGHRSKARTSIPLRGVIDLISAQRGSRGHAPRPHHDRLRDGQDRDRRSAARHGLTSPSNQRKALLSHASCSLYSCQRNDPRNN